MSNKESKAASKYIVLTTTKEHHAKVKKYSKANGLTLASFCMGAINSRIENIEAKELERQRLQVQLAESKE